MVNFVEKATLILDDKSTKNIDKINAGLRRMRKEASATQKALSKFKIPNIDGRQAKKVLALSEALRKLNRQAAAMKRINANVKIGGASASDISKLTRALNAYQKMSSSLLGSKQLNFANLDTLVQKLVRVARAANMASNAMGKLKANIPGNFNVNNYVPRNPRGQNVNLNIQPLRSLLRSFIVDLGHTIVNSVRQGFIEGTKGFDVATNKALQQRLSPDVRKSFENQAFAASQNFAGIRADQRMDLYAELATNFRNPLDALKFDKTIDKAVQVAMQQGETAEQAIQGLAQMFRGLGGAGYLVNQEGNMDPRVLKYIDAYTAAKVSEGAQINFRDFFQAMKYAKTTAQTSSPEAVFLQLLMAADVGASTSGVQANMLSKTLAAGETTKKALAAQVEAGFREGFKEVETGKIGNKVVKSLVGGELRDEEMFRTDPIEWIQKYISGPGGYLEKQGLSLNSDPAKIIKALDPLSGNRNSDDALSKAILQMTESLQKLEKFYNNPLSQGELSAINQQSTFVTFEETSNRFITLLGVAGDKLEQVFIPVLDMAGKAADRMTNILRGVEKATVADYTALGVAGVGAVGAGKLATSVLGFGLKGSAIALNGSAAALTRAAVALGGAGAVRGGVSAAGAAAAAGGAASGPGLLRMLGIPALAALTLGRGSKMTEESNPELFKMMRERLSGPIEQRTMALQMELESKQTQISKLQSQIADATKTGIKGSSPFMLDKTAELAALQTSTETIRAQLQAGNEELRSIFEAGTTQINQASSSFGATASEQILGIAASFGSAAGEAMKSVFGTPSVNLNQTTAPIPNTGTNTNLATGG